MSESVIKAAQRIELFLADEAVQAALQAMKEQNYELFRAAKDEEGRRMAQAQAIAMEAFESMMRQTVDAGERARIELERHERAPTSRQAKE